MEISHDPRTCVNCSASRKSKRRRRRAPVSSKPLLIFSHYPPLRTLLIEKTGKLRVPLSFSSRTHARAPVCVCVGVYRRVGGKNKLCSIPVDVRFVFDSKAKVTRPTIEKPSAIGIRVVFCSYRPFLAPMRRVDFAINVN